MAGNDGSLAELLARIDERTENTCNQVSQINTRLQNLHSEFVPRSEFNPDLFVSKTEYWPVRAIAFGIAAMILVGFLSALIALVITKRP